MIRTETIISRRYLRTVVAMSAAAVALLSCSDVGPGRSGTFYGPVVAMGGGSGRSYVITDRDGIPTDIGVALTEMSLTGLPAGTAEFVFALPAEAAATAYKHAAINWQPVGHPPPMVYTVPHFDVHFYMITQAARDGIVLGDAQLAAKMVLAPAAEFIPAGYAPGGASTQMGMHWNDPAAPERLGQPFTYTFIYGSYDGAVIFGEPMVTKAYLETKPSSLVTPLKLPAQYATRGYQATSYTVGYDAAAKDYRIALSGLVDR